MKASDDRPTASSDAAEQIRHFAARMEDAIQLRRQRRARRRGREAAVIPGFATTILTALDLPDDAALTDLTIRPRG